MPSLSRNFNCSALVLSLLSGAFAACGSAPPQSDPVVNEPMGTTGTEPPAVGTADRAVGSAGNGVVGTAAAGGGASAPGNAGTAGDGTSSAGSGTSMAGVGVPEAGSSGAQAGAVSSDDDAGVPVDAGTATEPSNPVAVDYTKPGPHQVLIENNVGERFRNDIPDDTARCRSFISATGSTDPELIERLTTYPDDMDRGLYTLFRPAQLEEGQKYPVITWGNGTCSHPLLFSELLEHLASHGFLVIATNTRWTAGAVEMLRAIDFMLSENENQDSMLFGKIATDMLGAAGHSQGSGATVTAGADRRIVATVPIQGASASEVRRLVGPTFLIAGENDTLVAPSGVESAFRAATVPAVYGLSLGQDHLMPGRAPAPILDGITAWFKIHLSSDTAARDFFYGATCKLCNDSRWTIMRRNL